MFWWWILRLCSRPQWSWCKKCLVATFPLFNNSFCDIVFPIYIKTWLVQFILWVKLKFIVCELWNYINRHKPMLFSVCGPVIQAGVSAVLYRTAGVFHWVFLSLFFDQLEVQSTCTDMWSNWPQWHKSRISTVVKGCL